MKLYDRLHQCCESCRNDLSSLSESYISQDDGRLFGLESKEECAGAKEATATFFSGEEGVP